MVRHSGRVLIGTSGWSYPHWRGPFYPRDLRHEAELAYYAQHFDSVEINSAFYRLPERSMLRTWRDAVPGDFVFAVKASRYITHMKKLNAPGAALKTFFRRIEALGDKLGPVLFQLPPRWHCSPRRLASFLGSLSSHFHYAFEFRDQSWSTSACTVRGHPTRDATTGARSPAGRSRFSRGLRKDDRHSATSTTISSRTPN